MEILGGKDSEQFPELSVKNAFALFNQQLSHAVVELRRMNERKDKSDLRHSLRHFGMEEEWKFAAYVFDRCLLIAFIIYLLFVVGIFIVPLMIESKVEGYSLA